MAALQADKINTPCQMTDVNIFAVWGGNTPDAEYLSQMIQNSYFGLFVNSARVPKMNRSV
jgi:hypothetical protein